MMDEAQRLQKEIAYYSKMISVHKQRNGYHQPPATNSRRHNISKVFNHSNKQASFDKTVAPQTGANTLPKPVTNPTNVKINKTFVRNNSSILHKCAKQAQNPSSATKGIAGRINSSATRYEKTNTWTADHLKQKRTTNKFSTKVLQSKKACLPAANALQSSAHAKYNNLSSYSWKNNTVTKTKESCSTTPSKKYPLEKEVSPKRKLTKSERVWRRRSSGEHKQQIQPNKTIILGKKIVTKYKLRRASLSRSANHINVSKNPYKVVKKSPGLTVNHSTKCFRRKRKYQSTNIAIKDYSQKSGFYYQKRRKVVLKPSKISSKYKLNRKAISMQTRSQHSGNIVLKRRVVHHRQKPEYFTGKVLCPTPQHYYSSVTQKLASNVLQRSLFTARQKSKHKLTKKAFCLFYNRFGKCNRGDKCPYRHDPERVVVCTRFLRGTCRDPSCLYSHKISKKKVPLCSFYLQGRCSAKDCPYLHVFVGHNAGVCKTFATTGYCQRADNCKQLHIRACPEFYETGSCTSKKTCRLPHKSKKKPFNKPAPESSSTTKHNRKVESDISTRGYGFIPLKQQDNKLPCELDNGAPELRIQPRLQKKLK